MVMRKYIISAFVFVLFTALFAHAMYKNGKRKELLELQLQLVNVKANILKMGTMPLGSEIEQLKSAKERMGELRKIEKKLKKEIAKLKQEIIFDKWKKRGEKAKKWVKSWVSPKEWKKWWGKLWFWQKKEKTQQFIPVE
ncbi:hypothetical protein ACFLYU_04195 [Candidatus Dependentiae bacterium]